MGLERKKTTAPDIVYTPASKLRSPRKLIREMYNDLVGSRELAWRLIIRDISARYRQTALGLTWAFLPPIATAVFFILLNRTSVFNATTTEIPYPVFVFLGTIFWQLFADALNAPLKAVSANKLMLAKINFPREALILSAMGQVLFDFLIRLIILAAVFIFFHIHLTWGLLFLPIATFMLMLLGIMIGLMIMPIGVLYTDISHGLTTFIGLWFFITPVVYEKIEHGILSILMKLNPVSPLLIGARDLAIHGTLLNGTDFFLVSGLTIIGLIIMWVVYRLSLPILIERIGA